MIGEPFEINYKMEKPKPKDPILIVGFRYEITTGVGSVGYKAVEHLKKELKPKKLADIHSMYFQGIEGVDGVAELFKDEIFYYDGLKHDLFIIDGFYQPTVPESEGSWQFAKEILGFCKELGIKKVFALGEFQLADLTKDPKIYCQVTDKKLLGTYGIEAHPQRTQTGGIEALLIGLGKQEGMEGVYFAGESCGTVMTQEGSEIKYYADTRSVIPMLKKIGDIMEVKIDTTDLKKDAEKVDGLLKNMTQSKVRVNPESNIAKELV